MCTVLLRYFASQIKHEMRVAKQVSFTQLFLISRYAPTRRKVSDLIELRKDKIISLCDSFTEYEKLIDKASKAVEFYEKLSKNVSDLQKSVQKAIEENEREKDAVIAKIAPKPGKQL